MLTLGQLFEVVSIDSPEPQTLRLVGLLGPDSTWVWMINIHASDALPFAVARSEAEIQLKMGTWVKVAGDPFPSNRIRTQDLSPSQKSRLDASWSYLNDVLKHGDELFAVNRRWKIVESVSANHLVSKNKVLRTLRRYWQRGMTTASLLPDIYQFGRPRKRLSCYAGAKRGVKSRRSTSFTMNHDDVGRCVRGYRRHYVQNPKASLRSAYFDTLNAYYSASRVIDETSSTTTIIKPAAERPTFNQFRWIVENQEDYASVTKSRKGEKNYMKDYRPLYGRGSDISFGPGAIYQIDATPWDITLVSTVGRVPIGKPTLYLVTDVFSHAVVGFHLSLGHAGYDPAAAALYSAISNKRHFAKLHGVDLREEEWPMCGAPQTIYADRGELIGKAIEDASASLRIQIANTAPFRADSKPGVESSFHAFNRFFLSQLPGYNPGYKRCENPAAEAVLDLHSIIRLLIKAIITYNLRILRNYPFRVPEFNDSVPHVPVELWNWGIQNRGGGLRMQPDEYLIPTLLRQESASITSRGIKFRSLYYTCDAERMVDLQVRARATGAIPVYVAFHPECVNRIFLKPSVPGDPYGVCTLTAESAVFTNCSFEEVKLHRTNQGALNASAEDAHDQSRAALQAAAYAEIEAGKQLANANPDRLKAADKAELKKAEFKINLPKNPLAAALPPPPEKASISAGDLLLPSNNDLSAYDALDFSKSHE